MSSPRNWRPRFEQQTARININNATWADFRRRCLDQGRTASEVLGELVTAHLDHPPVPPRERAPQPPPPVPRERAPEPAPRPTRERDDTEQPAPRPTRERDDTEQPTPGPLSLFDVADLERADMGDWSP